MTIKKLKELIDKWIIDKGFNIECDTCGETIKIELDDVMINCKACKCIYHAASYIIDEIVDELQD
jgi:uncharacterized Zn finger protein